MADSMLKERTEEIIGFTIIIPPKRSAAEIAIRGRLPVHAGMKFVPEEIVTKVIENEPMARVSRVNDIPNDGETKEKLLRQLLAMTFPEMIHFGSDYAISYHNDKLLDSAAKETEANYKKAGMTSEIGIMKNKILEFKKTRGGLKFILDNDLVNRSNIIPISYLPDMFMAVPVWYFYANSNALERINSRWSANGPRTTAWIADFCDLFPSQRWVDTFQLFNYRARGLDRYSGEIIPPNITKRMVGASEHFDYVVVATPYHDEAGYEWKKLKWERAIDPYLIGFKKGVPFFFILGRFSGTGTFPLLNELVADTIDFLRKNKESISGFDGIERQWNMAGHNALEDNYANTGTEHGAYLMKHVDMLLKAFEQGILFDWLRGEVKLAET